ncbi:AraC family transcriptional regulator [Paroceanicella profunda]|uniref:AraC family transcriptional regulator n=1 Tax=Paroceanicella profunda TaxID=2579971 RepID=A0A5B8FG65_9RHOB|nr:AraC family transcriptional regulator [Paroceanicella profunda]QDL90747.1 AraC family transcriptional regulator [Paroceanicella profunda]
MAEQEDWLSRLLAMAPLRGRLEIRCAFGAPWRLDNPRAPAGEIPWHVVLSGRAVLEGNARPLVAGDMVLLVDGRAHVLHDGSGAPPVPVLEEPAAGHRLARTEVRPGAHSGAAPFEMLCGRFLVPAAHVRLVESCLPREVVLQTGAGDDGRLAELARMMQAEAAAGAAGAQALLDACSAALFVLALRRAGATGAGGLPALAADPALAPAVAALFDAPERGWTLGALADLCHMSRATLARRFEAGLGRSPRSLLEDIRMARAAQALRRDRLSTAAAAALAGYASEAAFQRRFRRSFGQTPAQWRRGTRPAQESGGDAPD